MLSGKKAASAAPLRFVKSHQFVRQYLKIAGSPRHKTSVHNVWEFLEIIRNSGHIPEYFGNHPLAGKWKGWNDAHMAPDLILVWKKETFDGVSIIVLGALGSHSETGLA